ncbi:uncharacterized protein BJX67DRAFT_158323 [Aspergillus lucknowensis]|uniref:Uncharacterized protein n=1 Tax=Aspergillus lucknowensis TaxID=176173 RepID=A0ABR4M3Y4_9EURO
MISRSLWWYPDLARLTRAYGLLGNTQNRVLQRKRETSRGCIRAKTERNPQGYSDSPVDLAKLESYASPPLSPSTDWSLDLDPVRRVLFEGMDGDPRHLKQNGRQAHYTAQPGMLRRAVPRSSGSHAVDRFGRVGFHSTREDPSQTTERPRVPTYMDYGYTDSTFQGGALQGDELQPYPSALRDNQQRQQSFPSYEPDMVYNLGQQGPTQTPYEVMPPYPSRQSAALDSLSGPFAVPQYFAPNEPSGAGLQSPYLPSGLSLSAYNQPGPIGRSSASQHFPAIMADMTAVGAAGQQHPSSHSQTQTLSEPPPSAEPYRQFQRALRGAVNHTRAGRLVEASRSLLDISEWLVASARELGTFSLLASRQFTHAGLLHARLTRPVGADFAPDSWEIRELMLLLYGKGILRDDQMSHSDRLGLWNDFNICWLSLCQKQKDMTQELLQTGRQSSRTSLLSIDAMDSLGKELIRLCDRMEQHGLVDYQMGIWEEEILSGMSAPVTNRPDFGNDLTIDLALSQCLDLIENRPELTRIPAAAATSHT